MKVAAAANRDVSAAQPGPFQDCSDVVHIAVFFDGTGNNRDEDEASKKWSNVARMFDAALATADPTKATYCIYLSGVGTEYNGKATGWLDNSLIWLEDNAGGMGFGGGGDRRMDTGSDNVNARLRDVLIANARRMGGPLKKYADENRNKSFAEVNKALGKHRLVKIINLSVFGFSRGAALARAFSNRVLTQCKRDGDKLTYQGYPLRLNFMGLFDTVASFGVPAQNVRYPWDERDLIVSHDVERCVHFVAAHEVRYSFPVDLIRKNGQLHGGWEEKIYPGVHSDVGGGYEPDAQGITNNYARIPMHDMMREAVVHGVRMMSYDQVQATNYPLFEERFECRKETAEAYRSYMAGLGAVSGIIEQQFKRHLAQLYSAYGTMHRLGIETVGDKRRQESKYKYIGPKGMAWEVGKYRTAVKLGRSVRLSDEKNVLAQYVKPQAWQLSAWDSNAPSGVLAFVSKLVHDSKVDFIGNLIEPFSYFRMRGIQESTRSVWQETGDWIGGKATQAEEAAQAAYATTKKKAGEAYDATAQKTGEVYDATKKKAGQAYDTTKQKVGEAYDATKQKAVEAYDVTKQKTIEAYDATKQAAVETYETTKDAAAEAYDAAEKKVEQGYDATKRAAADAAAEANRRYDEANQEAYRIFEQGKKWVEQAAKEASEQAESLANAARRVGRP